MAEKANESANDALKPTNVVFSASDDAEVAIPEAVPAPAMTALLFQEPDVARAVRSRRNRREEAGVAESTDEANNQKEQAESSSAESQEAGTQNPQENSRKRRRGTRGGRRSNDPDTSTANEDGSQDTRKSKNAKKTNGNQEENPDTDTAKADTEQATDKEATDTEPTVRRRRRRRTTDETNDEVATPKGSTRLEAKRRRRREGRDAGRRRQTITESEYLARREAVDRDMLIREQDGLNQIAVLEDGVLVEHYVARHTQATMVGNVYLGRVQNVLPSMEAAFVDIGKGRNAVLYAGEVNWDAAGMEGEPRKIEHAMKSGDTVLVQVTKDPIGHKGARLTGQVTLAGRHLVLVPNGAMTGISRKLPDRERGRLKKILKEIVPAEHGVIVRTAAEGATEEQLSSDIERLMKAWKDIEAKSKSSSNAPSLLKGEPELAVRVVRDIFNEDFKTLKVSGENAWETISEYVQELSPELVDRLEKWESNKDIFEANRIDEQLAKAFDRKVFLPSGGSLVIDRTEAMTVVDVNTGRFTGTGGTLEETVTRNNLEAAEEIVRQLRLRDIGGIIVIDFIDMVLEANRDLVMRRLIECLGRDRTRHQVAEVTSLGLVQMTRKRVGQGLVEAFSTTCTACDGHGFITHDHPIEKDEEKAIQQQATAKRAGAGQSNRGKVKAKPDPVAEADAKHEEVKAALASIAAAASAKHEEKQDEAAKQGEKTTEHKELVEKKQNLPARRRVTSSGTITPTSSASSAIMTFPVKKK
ncbi:MAG: Rne/Rng family ribonuclease [Actinomycetaceae bacterium]|nr:Rne/Rng family ribonuclease [Actinomycetaceae bacterium]